MSFNPDSFEDAGGSDGGDIDVDVGGVTVGDDDGGTSTPSAGDVVGGVSSPDTGGGSAGGSGGSVIGGSGGIDTGGFGDDDGGGGASTPSPDPEPQPPSVGEIRQDIGGVDVGDVSGQARDAAGRFTEAVRDVGAEVRDRVPDLDTSAEPPAVDAPRGGLAPDAPGRSTATDTGLDTRVRSREDLLRGIDAVGETADRAQAAAAPVVNPVLDAAAEAERQADIDDVARTAVATEQRIDDPVQGPTGRVDRGLAELGGAADAASQDALADLREQGAQRREAFESEIVDPTAEQVGESVERTFSAPDAAPEDTPQLVDPEFAGGAAEAATRGIGADTIGPFVGIEETAIDTGSALQGGAEFAAESIEEEGVVRGTERTAEAAGAIGAAAAGRGARQAVENPARTAGALFGGIVTGSAAARGLERGVASARLAAETAGSSVRVDFEDITSARGAQGDLPEFDTSPQAPTGQATAEVRRRARDQPDDVQRAAGDDQVLFRSEAERLPGDVEAQRGNFELPGLFTSPDASPLRLEGATSTSTGGLSLRLPNLRGQPERLSAFESPDIEGAPARAAGSGRVAGPDGEPRPDPETAGAQFLEGEADQGTAFVRPTGDRTTELEAIFPPGTRFQRAETGRVDLPGGGGATLDIFQQARRQGDADTDLDSGDTFTPAEIAARSERGGVPDDRPVTPTGVPTDTAGPTEFVNPFSGTVTGTSSTSEPRGSTGGNGPTGGSGLPGSGRGGGSGGGGSSVPPETVTPPPETVTPPPETVTPPPETVTPGPEDPTPPPVDPTPPPEDPILFPDVPTTGVPSGQASSPTTPAGGEPVDAGPSVPGGQSTLPGAPAPIDPGPPPRDPDADPDERRADEQPLFGEELLPETPLFSNPIADVFLPR